MTKQLQNKIEAGVIININGGDYHSSGISNKGKRRWGRVFDNLDVNYENSERKNKVRMEFINWAQNTLSVCPSLDSLGGKNNDYYREILKTKIIPGTPVQ
ncbi:MAG: hypothetical protein PVJ67_01625 [Candidatus Pacearchaeota archaeon]|jgi:hypothetical protein